MTIQGLAIFQFDKYRLTLSRSEQPQRELEEAKISQALKYKVEHERMARGIMGEA